MFLNSLLKEYKNIHQLLKFHTRDLDQIIKSLSATEAHMKDEKKTPNKINIMTKSARRTRTKWLKTAKYYNCNEIKHIVRNCKKLKKNHKNNKKANKDDEKIKEKIKKKAKKLIN